MSESSRCALLNAMSAAANGGSNAGQSAAQTANEANGANNGNRTDSAASAVRLGSSNSGEATANGAGKVVKPCNNASAMRNSVANAANVLSSAQPIQGRAKFVMKDNNSGAQNAAPAGVMRLAKAGAPSAVPIAVKSAGT